MLFACLYGSACNQDLVHTRSSPKKHKKISNTSAQTTVMASLITGTNNNNKHNHDDDCNSSNIVDYKDGVSPSTAVDSLSTASADLKQQQNSSTGLPTTSSTNANSDPPSSSRDIHEEGDPSVEQVSRLLREEDADLLESMHYASSQVSQYSPGGTPILRPKDRALPLVEHLPMIPASVLSSPAPPLSKIMQEDTCESDSHYDYQQQQQQEKQQQHRRPQQIRLQHQQKNAGSSASDHSNIQVTVKAVETARSGGLSETDAPAAEPAQKPQELQQAARDDFLYRRCLSGEVTKGYNHSDAVPNDDQTAEEAETTASPVSVAQEANCTITVERDSGLAERRRMNEARQFAEAVGEMPPVNRDELRIIEDHTDDDDSDDSDDDEACESKEIHITSIETIKESMHQLEGPIDDRSCGTLPKLVDVHDHPSASRRKSRPIWPFPGTGAEYSFLDKLSDGLGDNDFQYKGICANPPEITKRGISRGNYAQLHRKAWLEVSDKYHRYGKNLRLYYRYWERLGFPTNQFFDWLDSKGEAAGQPLPLLEDCPRTVLDADTVLYITNPEVTERYRLDFECNEEGRARVVDIDGDPVQTGHEGWIFVLRDNALYGAQKITSISGHSKQRFHHSSFFGGKAVASAGILITDDHGYLYRLYPHSGHYRPGEAHMQRMLFFLHRKGVDLRTFEMDTQQFRHVARDKEVNKGGKDCHANGKVDKPKGEKPAGEKKAKKVDCLHLEKAVHVACFLSHKAGFVGNRIFDCIHKIRKADVTSVSEALQSVDEFGGFWCKNRKDANKEAETQMETTTSSAPAVVENNNIAGQ